MSSDPDRARQAYEDDCKDDATSGIDLYALFVLDATIPTTTINKVLRDAFDDLEFDSLWLAEDYDSIDVHCGEDPGLLSRGDKCTVVDKDWKSPWAGKELEEVVDFVRRTPKPPKALNKVHFVILDKEQYTAHERLTVCKIVDGDVQSLACDASSVSTFLETHHRDTWPERVRQWQERGVPIRL